MHKKKAAIGENSRSFSVNNFHILKMDSDFELFISCERLI